MTNKCYTQPGGYHCDFSHMGSDLSVERQNSKLTLEERAHDLAASLEERVASHNL